MRSGRRTAPDHPFQKALALQRAGQTVAAEAAYKAILRLRPQHGGALSNLAVLYRQKGRLAEARQALEQCVGHDPSNVAAWSNLTNVYLDLGLKAKAVEAGRQAVARGPGQPRPLGNLGWALWQCDRFEEAREVLEASLALDPKDAVVWNNLGNVHQRQCRIDDAIAAYRKALDCNPSMSMAMQNIAFCMHFSERYTPKEIAEQHFAWARLFESREGITPLPAPAPATGKPRLRVAFMSPDLREHPVAAFLRPLIQHWPSARFELAFYSEVKAPDAATGWFKERAEAWCDSIGMTDAQLAQRIRADGVDILIDLCGHTAGNRLLVMPFRAAPVQATWLGYFDTTGMKSVDYVIADVVCVQPGEEGRFSETVVKLPHDFVCYSAPSAAPDIGPLPFDRTGRFTFGSQNQLVKLTPAVIALWARIVAQVPDSRLLLAGKAFNDDSTQERFRQAFEAAGLERSRLVLKPGTNQLGVLATYNEIDLALDPFPCAGGTTTCEALYMGVPVVSLYGERFAGRHSAAHLQSAGLPQFVARDEAAYAALAQRLASDPTPLRELRARMRAWLPSTPLMDGASFAGYFEAALVQMWRRTQATAATVA